MKLEWSEKIVTILHRPKWAIGAVGAFIPMPPQGVDETYIFVDALLTLGTMARALYNKKL